MLAEVKDEKGQLIEKRQALKKEYKEMSDQNAMKPHKLNQIRKLDQDLETEYFQILEMNGEEKPKAPYGQESQQADMINRHHEEKMERENKRVLDIKKQFDEDQKAFAEVEKKRRLEQGLPEESSEEETPVVASAKTTISTDKMHMRTESESESEFQTKIRGNRVQKDFLWTPKNEAKLEEILMKNEFEFKAAAREFCEYINKDSEEYFEITQKAIQLRWTDIEIRKFRLDKKNNGVDIPDDYKIDVMDPNELPQNVQK